MAGKKLLSGRMPHLLLCAATVLAYLPSFSGDFILDDNPLIRNNPYVRVLHPAWSYLAQEDGIAEHGGAYHTGYYRPLLNLSYWFDYRLWGLNPAGFRTTNLALHLLTVWILFRVLSSASGSRRSAFWAVLLFALHPANTESVAWAASRNNILVTLFTLLAFHFYRRNWEDGGTAALLAAAVSYALALLSKEFALLLLPILFLYHRFLRLGKAGRLQECLSYLPFLLLTVGYLSLRQAVVESWLPPLAPGELLQRAAFAPYLVLVNLGLILVPSRLHSLIVSYPAVGFGPQAAAGLVFLLLLAGALWRMRRNRLFCFSVLGFLAALFPVLHILPGSSVTLVSLRWLYFPMAFLLFGLAGVFEAGLKARPTLLTVLVISLAVYFGGYTWVLNKYLWHDEGTFFHQEVQGFQNRFYAGGLAERCLKEGRIAEAERYFLLALAESAPEARHHINYAALLLDTGRCGEALEHLGQAKRLPMSPREQGDWFNNTGMAHFCLGKRLLAVESLRTAVRLDPQRPVFWANLGAAYGSAGEQGKALAVLNAGLALAPGDPQLLKNLAVTHLRSGERDKALAALQAIPRGRWQAEGIPQLLELARGAR